MVIISDPLSKILDVSKENNSGLIKDLQEIANDNNSVVLALIAPYVGKKVSPTKEISAFIGLSEEFGVETVLSEIKKENPNSEGLILLLNSPGGLVQSSYKIARALRKNFKDIRVFVPHIAASGGTLISLIGNEIVMGLMSQLSPIDPQSNSNGESYSCAAVPKSFQNVTSYFENKTEDDAPYTYKLLADKFDPIFIEECLGVCTMMEDYTKEILSYSGYKEDEIKDISRKLVLGYSTHEEVINFDKAKRLGIRVVEDVKYSKEWNTLRMWLGNYLLTSADKHVIRYVLPQAGEMENKIEMEDIKK